MLSIKVLIFLTITLCVRCHIFGDVFGPDPFERDNFVGANNGGRGFFQNFGHFADNDFFNPEFNRIFGNFGDDDNSRISVSNRRNRNSEEDSDFSPIPDSDSENESGLDSELDSRSEEDSESGIDSKTENNSETNSEVEESDADSVEGSAPKRTRKPKRKPRRKKPASNPTPKPAPTSTPLSTPAPASASTNAPGAASTAAPTPAPTPAPSPITNKNITRPRLTKSVEARARQAIKDFVDEHKEDDGTRPFNAALLRLSFHDCIGPRGCDGCINHLNIANENLQRAADPLDELYDRDFENLFTRADFYALSGIVAAEYAAELADCEGEGCIPNVPFKFGRLDCPKAQDQIHIFCPFNDDTEEFLTEQFNGTLTDEDMVAILGAHSIGRVNRDDGDAFDETPDALDTDYYKQLTEHEGWKQATGVRTSDDLDKSWMRDDGTLLMLGADISLISDISNGKDATCNPGPMKCQPSKFRDIVKTFAESGQKHFIQKFAIGMAKYISKTSDGSELFDPVEG